VVSYTAVFQYGTLSKTETTVLWSFVDIFHLSFLFKHLVKMWAKRLTPMPSISRLCFTFMTFALQNETQVIDALLGNTTNPSYPVCSVE